MITNNTIKFGYDDVSVINDGYDLVLTDINTSKRIIIFFDSASLLEFSNKVDLLTEENNIFKHEKYTFDFSHYKEYSVGRMKECIKFMRIYDSYYTRMSKRRAIENGIAY